MPSKVIEPRHGARIQSGVVMSLIAVLVSLVVSLLYPPFCLRMVGEVNDGIYQYAASFVLFLSLLSFGIENSYVRFATRALNEGGEDKVRRVHTFYLILFSIVGIIEILGTLVVWSLFKTGLVTVHEGGAEQELMCNYILLLGCSQGIGFILSMFSWNLFFKTHFIVYQSAQILTKILSASIGAVALTLGGEAIYVGVAVIIANVVSGLLCMFICIFKHEMKFSWMKWDEAKPLLKEILHFSAYVFMSMVVSELNAGFGRWAIGTFGHVADVTLIGYGIEFYVYQSLLVLAISRIFIPSINDAVISGDTEQVHLLYRRCAFATAIVAFMVAGGFSACGKPFVYAWLNGTDLTNSAKDTVYYLGCSYLWCFALPLTGNAGTEVARAMNRHQFNSKFNLIAALIGAAVSLVLVVYLPAELKIYGPVMGLGTSSFISFGIVNNYIWMDRLKMPIGSHIVRAVALWALAALSCGLVHILVSGPLDVSAWSYWAQAIVQGLLFLCFFVVLIILIFRDEVLRLVTFRRPKQA